MNPFDHAFARTIGLEGGYSDHPADRGGPTRYGITELVARANGYEGDMRELALEDAKRIARLQYWDLLRLDDVAILDERLSAELFDTSFNMGVGTAGRFLQRALNALNRGGFDYPDLEPDGVVGPITVARLRAYVLRRGVYGPTVLLRALNALQGARYVEITEADPRQESFLYGWLANRL